MQARGAQVRRLEGALLEAKRERALHSDRSAAAEAEAADLRARLQDRGTPSPLPAISWTHEKASLEAEKASLEARLGKAEAELKAAAEAAEAAARAGGESERTARAAVARRERELARREEALRTRSERLDDREEVAPRAHFNLFSF